MKRDVTKEVHMYGKNRVKKAMPENAVAPSCDFDSSVARVRQMCEKRHVYMERNVKRDVCI